MTNKELLRRIEELERKVAELERDSLLKPYQYYFFPLPQIPQVPADPNKFEFRWTCKPSNTAATEDWRSWSWIA